MTKASAEELISAYVDGELDEAQQAQVERLLVESPDARRLLAELRKLQEMLQNLPQHHAKDNLAGRVQKEIEQPQVPLLPPMALSVDQPKESASKEPPFRDQPQRSAASAYAAHRRKQSRRWWTMMAATATAVAASALLAIFFWPGGSRPPVAAGDPGVQRPADPPGAADSSGNQPKIAEMPLRTRGQRGGADPQPPAAPADPLERPSPRQQQEQRGSGLLDGQMPGTAVDGPPQTEAASILPSAISARVVDAAAARPPSAAPPPRGPFTQFDPVSWEIVVLLDFNSDGLLSDAELRQSLDYFPRLVRSRKPQPGQLLLAELDQDGDQQLSESEIWRGAAAARRQIAGSGAEVARLLNAIDANRDGKVDSSELQALVEQLGEAGRKLEPRLAPLLTSVDGDGDEAIGVVESQWSADQIAGQLGLQVTASPGPTPLAVAQQTVLRLDRSRDGKLSRREVERDPQLGGRFEMLDVDADHFLTPGELLEHLLSGLPAEPSSDPFRFRL